jgi:polyphosphate kinase
MKMLSHIGTVDRVRYNKLIQELSHTPCQADIAEDKYYRALFQLQCELIKLQDWVAAQKLKIVVIFEGRDAAGKGGMIKRMAQRLNPRLCRIVALPAPGERERTQWYFQRYVSHLPAGGEIVFFDRSWYNRAGVERVMGFCTEEEYREFLDSVPYFERLITRSGIILIKYWFSISHEEQLRRLMERASNPLKQWKLSAIDIESFRRWDDYTRAKETMLERTHIAEAPWWIVNAVCKRRARLNCIHHFLRQVPYQELPPRTFALPEELPGNMPAKRSPSHAIEVPELF